MYWLLTLLFGAIVGFSLGLTGGGGAIFAVPMLVFGLGVAPREAVGISLVAVGMTSFVGFLGRWHARKVEHDRPVFDLNNHLPMESRLGEYNAEQTR